MSSWWTSFRNRGRLSTIRSVTNSANRVVDVVLLADTIKGMDLTNENIRRSIFEALFTLQERELLVSLGAHSLLSVCNLSLDKRAALDDWCFRIRVAVAVMAVDEYFVKH